MNFTVQDGKGKDYVGKGVWLEGSGHGTGLQLSQWENIGWRRERGLKKRGGRWEAGGRVGREGTACPIKGTEA